MRALVVDDSRSMRAIIGKLLKELGFDVEEAASGLEALEALNRNPAFDLMLLDWNMPHMDGFELLRRVRTEPRFEDLPVMMVTTESEISQVEVALGAGANEYLMKPFDRHALLQKLMLIGVDPDARAA
jgi:two-component system, chemotaxis family, chemotaxis protein CheY